MLVELWQWIQTSPAQSIPILSAGLGLVAGGVWTVLTFFHKIYSDREQRLFERYRLLSKEITVGRDGDDLPYIAYQLDAIYELRFFRKYYPRTIWMLKGLRGRWENSTNYDKSNLAEIDDTISYIAHRKNLGGSILFCIFNFFWWFKMKSTILNDK